MFAKLICFTQLQLQGTRTHGSLIKSAVPHLYAESTTYDKHMHLDINKTVSSFIYEIRLWITLTVEKNKMVCNFKVLQPTKSVVYNVNTHKVGLTRCWLAWDHSTIIRLISYLLLIWSSGTPFKIHQNSKTHSKNVLNSCFNIRLIFANE